MTEQDKIIQDLQKEIEELKRSSISLERLQDEVDRLKDRAKTARYEGYEATYAYCIGCARYIEAIIREK